MTRKELITSDEYLHEYYKVAVREKWSKSKIEKWIKDWRDEIIAECSPKKEEKRGLNYDELSKKFDEAIESIDISEFDDKGAWYDKIPAGWVSIEEHLPACLAFDFINKGYSEYDVKFEDGSTGVTQVIDHNTWYYYARENGITHWFNHLKKEKTEELN